jgi:dTDP-4-dehydrorhamnose reductase
MMVLWSIGTMVSGAGGRCSWAEALGIHHFTDAGAASWYDFAVAIQEEALLPGLLPRAVPIEPIASTGYPTPARRPAFSVLDCFQTWALTGKPVHWREELRAMLREVAARG